MSFRFVVLVSFVLSKEGSIEFGHTLRELCDPNSSDHISKSRNKMQILMLLTAWLQLSTLNKETHTIFESYFSWTAFKRTIFNSLGNILPLLFLDIEQFSLF